MTAGQVSVGGAIRYAWSLLASNWRQVWGALALNALAATVSAAGLYSGNQMLQTGAAPAMLLTTVMLNGALFRLAFADRHGTEASFKPDHHGLQWGRVEWRLLAAQVLVFVFMLVVLLIAVIGIGAILAGLSWAGAVQLPEPQSFGKLVMTPAAAKDPALIVPLMALTALAAWLRTRLSLSLPASVDQSGVKVLSTWKLTRGKVWPILASVLFIALPVMILSAYVSINLRQPGGLDIDAGPTAVLIASLVQGLAEGVFLTPMVAGVTAYFYRQLVLPGAAPDPGAKP